MIHPIFDAVIFDAEIRNCIPGGMEPRDPNLNYCGGWTDHANMGITVICAYDMAQQMPRVFLRDNFDEFLDLVGRREFLIGFNSLRFDDKVLAANNMHIQTTFDLMVEAKIASGYKAGTRIEGFSLDKIALTNLGVGKKDNGARAPENWQKKRPGTVIDYCMGEIMLMLKLLLMGWGDGLTCPVNNTPNHKLRGLLEAKHGGKQLRMFT
jgi:hypothetical protein